MGPRSCNRGELSSECLKIGLHSLLQWGRGHVPAESTGIGLGLIEFAQASMGPRSCNRGELANSSLN